MTQLEALWQYQEAEMTLEKLEKELKTTPARQKFNKLRVFLREQTNQITVIQTGLSEKAEALDASCKRLEELLNEYDLEQGELDIMADDEECTAAELTEARIAIERLMEKVGVLKKQLVDTTAWVEKTTQDVNAMWAKAGKAKKEYDALKVVCDTEQAEAKPRLDTAKRDVERAALQVGPEYMKKYMAVKKNYAQPMAKVENNQCGGCNMSLPIVVVRRVSAGSGIVECENCGRILCM